MGVGLEATARQVLDLAGAVPDPEIPVLTLGDLGVIRSARVTDGGAAEVAITPTYSGCPAVQTMRADIATALAKAGFAVVRVTVVLHPAWSTDWISPNGRAKLAQFGIAPPRPAAQATGPVDCPHCGDQNTRLVSPFGPTPCQAQRLCTACCEPFHHFKELA